MLNGRKRFITALSGLALTAVVGIVPSSPAQADPSLGDTLRDWLRTRVS